MRLFRCQYGGSDRQYGEWSFILLACKSVPSDKIENLLTKPELQRFHMVMFVSHGCTAHVGNSFAVKAVGSGKVQRQTQVLKFHLRHIGVGKCCQIFISTVNWTIQGVSFHVAEDKGRVWMRVGGEEECDGI